jgi:hypothetical protein
MWLPTVVASVAFCLELERLFARMRIAVEIFGVSVDFSISGKEIPDFPI